MFSLHLIDVSALLHFGMNSTKYKDKTSYTYNVGGIHKVMRHIAIAIANNDDVILAFDSSSNFRKRIMPEYKAGRIPNKFVISQAELLWERLPSTGITCYKFDGYEGDDIISWCTQIAPRYNNVYIHANDKDLIHNVRNNVVFHSITSTINNVTAGNFPFAIEKGIQVPFNFVSVRKVLTGCTSDKIAAFRSDAGYTGAEIFDWYLKALDYKQIPFIYENTTNRNLFLKVMEALPGVTARDLEELRKRVQVIFPAEAPADFVVEPTMTRQINKDKLSQFLSFVNDFETIKALRLYRTDLNEEERQILKERQNKLLNGAFAVDRNMTVHDNYDDSLLTLKEF